MLLLLGGVGVEVVRGAVRERGNKTPLTVDRGEREDGTGDCRGGGLGSCILECKITLPTYEKKISLLIFCDSVLDLLTQG